MDPRMTSALGAALLAMAGATGCNPDTAVFVEASIDSVTLAAEQSSLSTGVAGNFILSLHLGPRASDASEVDLGLFSITDASRSTTIVPTLGFTAAPSFPVTVDVDSTVDMTITLPAEDNLVEADALTALCAAEGVVVVGAIEDSLAGGGTVDVASDPTTLSGCP
jgi:hypothetical protein